MFDILNVQKHIIVLNTTDLREKLDILPKIQIFEYNSLSKSHQVRLYGLKKPKYCGKEFQKVKVA